MKTLNFYLPIFDWDITFVTIYNKQDKEPLRVLLESINIRPEDIESELDIVEKELRNGGTTWRECTLRKIIVIIFPWDSKEEFYNVINHEKRHIVDRICEHHRIEDIETPAHIDGYISSIIYSRIKELI